MVDQGGNKWAWVTHNSNNQAVEVCLGEYTFANGSFQSLYCMGYQRIEANSDAPIYPITYWENDSRTPNGTRVNIYDSRFVTALGKR